MAYHPYLFFGGNCREAFTRYHEVFGGDLTLLTASDMPAEQRPPEDTGDLIMHAALVHDDGALLMGSDDPTTDSFGPVQGMQVNFSTPDVDEAKRVFGALAEGGTVNMEPRTPAGRRTSAWCPIGSARRGWSAPTRRSRPADPLTLKGSVATDRGDAGRRTAQQVLMAGEPASRSRIQASTCGRARDNESSWVPPWMVSRPTSSPIAHSFVRRAAVRAGTTMASAVPCTRRIGASVRWLPGSFARATSTAGGVVRGLW